MLFTLLTFLFGIPPGYKTGVITNNWVDDVNVETNQLMTQFLNSHFDTVLQSCQLGIRKPNPLIYRLACHRLGVQPSQVMQRFKMFWA